MLLLVTCLFCLFNRVISDAENSPRIIIVGAGSSGIAAASKLFENGFDNILILEAENRIGGRIHTTQFGEYLIDLGAQWVHGQVNNVAYELAAPLDLLANTTWQSIAYDSTGRKIDDTVFQDGILFFLHNLTELNVSDPSGSAGEYYEKQFSIYFKDHPEINSTLQKGLLRLYNLISCSLSAADTWYDISLKGDIEYENCEGELSINWKKRGYSTILDILMKKFPDPSKELPVVNNTILNTEVINIDYTADNGSIKIRTLDAQEYLADHVIMTTSLGVLKENYESLFNPPLSESKITTIKGLAFGTVCKIFMQFDEPWWEYNLEWRSFNFLFNETYINKLESDENKRWLASAIAICAVEDKPHLLAAWIAAKGCRLVETLPDDMILEHIMELMHTFLGKDYNITKPTAIMKTNWTQNKHFRGTYSFRSVDSEKVNASAEILSEPIMKNQTPVMLFAGEATNKSHYGTVHGAIASGWREADRLIKFYAKTS
ncbi:hypothetical protein KPH14_010458 [Odynerus spinipes]|uniref:Amine oxidase domain-containing protein n=1 Tax=Odynerus spinipes TaxID=1348599 RepID=A0AAD9RTV7_9HYME|nr:hypothetical protein KPH14_010458 [Odynerus spinipes]